MCSYIGDPMIAMRELAESYQHAAIYAVASGVAVSLGASLYGLRDFRRVSAVGLLCTLGVAFALAGFAQQRILILAMMAFASATMVFWRSNMRWANVPLLLATIYATIAMGHAQWILNKDVCEKWDSSWFKVAI